MQLDHCVESWEGALAGMMGSASEEREVCCCLLQVDESIGELFFVFKAASAFIDVVWCHFLGGGESRESWDMTEKKGSHAIGLP